MKKLFLLLFIGICTFSMKQVDALLIEHRTGYGYDAGDTHYSLKFYEDEDTHKPVFRLGYDYMFEDSFLFEETDSVNLTDEELNLIQDYIFYITEGRSYNDCTMTELIGVQALIWEIYSTKTDIPLKWSCDVGFLVDYRKMINEKKKSYETPKVFHYITPAGTTLKIDLLPLYDDVYTLSTTESTISILKNENTFEILAKTPGNYTLDLDASLYHSKYHFYETENTQLIELVKMKSTKPIIELEVSNTKEPLYQINTILDKGITLKLEKNLYESFEEVNFDYEINADYELTSIEITTLSGVNINFEDNKFIMPNEGVLIHISTTPIIEEIQKYKVNVENKDGIIVYTHDEEEVSNQVIFHYELEDSYELEYFLLKTETDSITLYSPSFIMPSSDVTIIPVLKKIESNIPIESTDENKEIYPVPNTKKDKSFVVYIPTLIVLVYAFYVKKCKV